MGGSSGALGVAPPSPQVGGARLATLISAGVMTRIPRIARDGVPPVEVGRTVMPKEIEGAGSVGDAIPAWIGRRTGAGPP